MKENDLIKSWVLEAQLGNHSGFNKLVTFYHAQLLAYALKICKFSNIAEDALQDSYISAHIHISEIKEPDHFIYWIRSIVKRTCWQYLNNRNSHLPLSIRSIDKMVTDKNLETEIEKNNMNEFVWERISRLSESLRIVVLLRYFTGFNEYEIISQVLGIPVGTVRSRLNEAKKQLRKIWHLELSGMPDEIRREADYWNEFYDYSFKFIQSDVSVRNKFNNHLMPDLKIKFTSGKTEQGRKLIEMEIEDDIKYGTSYHLGTVFNLRDIGIIQGENINSAEYPDRCPPTSTLIFHRKTYKTYFLQFHNPSASVLDSSV